MSLMGKSMVFIFLYVKRCVARKKKKKEERRNKKKTRSCGCAGRIKQQKRVRNKTLRLRRQANKMGPTFCILYKIMF